MGPEATPPESKAMAVKILGTKKDSTMAMAYPGMRSHRMEIPVSTRTMASPMDAATPADSAAPMAELGIAPSVISSTCRLRT